MSIEKTVTNLETLKINYLTEAMYEDALENDQINDNELYMTPSSSSSTPTADTLAEFDSTAHMNSTDMTTAEVTSFVNSLDLTGSKAADYIVEQGTSGIWTYRKWASGIAECWGITAETTLSFSAWGDMYEAKVCDAIPFPTNLYITVPTVVANAIPTSGYAIMSTEFSANGVTTSQTPTLYAIRPNTASGRITACAHIHAIGKWK